MNEHAPSAGAPAGGEQPSRDTQGSSDAESRLAALTLQQEQLAQGVAHDLRAPLRAIDGFAAMLAKHAGESLDATGRDYLQRIRDAAHRMGSLVDALQTYSRVGRAPLREAPVDLSLLAEWVAADLQDAEPGRAARIDVAPGLAVHGDEGLLRELLRQLLDNAWKFSAPRERVEVRVEGERDGDRLRLRIRDQGIGFDMQYMDKLFQPFQRLHGTDQGAGAGFGLAIAQCIAHRHGGRIHAESQSGGGSVFHVELPVGSDPETAA
jgi:signal transduction histidine kinase